MTADINSFNASSDIEYQFTILQGIYLVDDPKLDVTIVLDRPGQPADSGHGTDPCSFFHPEMAKQMQLEYELNTMFEDSIKKRDFQIYLQPKVRLADLTLSGAEALVRWIHPDKGMICPSDFIPLFEENGKICRLDLYVYETVWRLSS